MFKRFCSQKWEQAAIKIEQSENGKDFIAIKSTIAQMKTKLTSGLNNELDT